MTTESQDPGLTSHPKDGAFNSTKNYENIVVKILKINLGMIWLLDFKSAGLRHQK